MKRVVAMLLVVALADGPVGAALGRPGRTRLRPYGCLFLEMASSCAEMVA